MIAVPRVRDPRRVTLALLAVQLLFGIHYVVAKLIVSAMAPAAWACLRSASAFLVLLVLALVFRRRLPARRRLAWLALCALFGVVLNQALFLEGLARTTAAHAAVMNTQIPTFALLAAVLMGQERLTTRKLASFLLGLAGVLVLLRADTLRFDESTLTGDLLNLANAASYGLFIALSRKVMAEEDTLAATAVLFGFATLGLGAYGLDEVLALDSGILTAGLIGAMLFAVLGATVASYLLNVWAVKRTQASHVALFIFLQPLVAAALGVIALGERITPRLSIALALVFLALALRNGQPEAARLAGRVGERAA